MSRLTHTGEDGAARMVDVSAKAETVREATAAGQITMSEAALVAVRTGNAAKGDVLGAARIAGIMAAKRTSELIPLCHPLPLASVTIEFSNLADGIEVRATARCTGRTGVEMEAITATCLALLTIYDMAKAIDRAMVIGEVRLLTKTGGKSGEWIRP